MKEQVKDTMIMALGILALACVYISGYHHWIKENAKVTYCESLTESIDILGPSNFHNCWKAIN